jgi:hypothetical protein
MLFREHGEAGRRAQFQRSRLLRCKRQARAWARALRAAAPAIGRFTLIEVGSVRRVSRRLCRVSLCSCRAC